MTRVKRRTRGVVAVAVSGVIAALIYFGVATPHPELRTAYLICVGVGVWGLIDIAWSLGAARSGRGE
jgi:multidrug transporter EmrE-like cation transporter